MTTPVNPLVREAEGKTEEIDRKVREFFEKVNGLLDWVPGALTQLIEPIQRGLQQLQQKLAEFWDRVNQLFEQPGNSDRLKEVGDSWANSIGNPVGDTAGDISLEKLRANIEWTGKAAEAYKAMVPAQGESLSGIKNLAIQLQNSLTGLANAIDSFWTANLIALGTFVVGVVGAIAAACTVVGVPAAIAAIATAAGVSIGLIATAVNTMNSLVDTIETEQNSIKQKIQDLGSEWSKSNADLSDGSVSDGDATDWRVNS